MKITHVYKNNPYVKLNECSMKIQKDHLGQDSAFFWVDEVIKYIKDNSDIIVNNNQWDW